MGEVAVAIFKWSVKFGFFMMVCFLWVSITAMILESMTVPASGNLIADILAMVQIWSPFNIASVVAWLVTSISSYIGYKLIMHSYRLIESFISN